MPSPLSLPQSPRPAGLTYLLGSLVSLPTMAMTLIAPAIPELRLEFGASYNEAQLLISLFLAAMAFGLLFVGFLSDRFGRRPIFLVGAALFFTSSLAGYFATSISVLIGARMAQGIGAAALMISGRIIASDVFSGKDASRALSAVTAVQSIAPIVALSLGGIIVELFGWRASFSVMALFSGVVLVQSYSFLQESNHNKLAQLRLSLLAEAFRTVLSSHAWQLYSLCAGLHIGMFYSMNGYMSYHFTRLGASVTEFGFYYSAISLGYLIGNLINRRVVSFWALGKCILFGSWIALFAIGLLWASDTLGILTPFYLSLLLICVGFAHGFIVANAIISSLADMGAHSGSANGIGAALHMLIGGLAGSLIISLGGATDFWICMLVNLIMGALSVLAVTRAMHLSS